MINWIKTTEKIPEYLQDIIFIIKEDVGFKREKYIGFFYINKFIAEDYDFSCRDVTHWAPVTDINNPEEDKS